MITRFHVQHYKALRDVTLVLTPLHVLIGPNDSGKTSILEALVALCRSVDYPLPQAFTGAWEGCELVWQHLPSLPIVLGAQIDDEQQQFEYRLECAFATQGHDVRRQGEQLIHRQDPEIIDLARSNARTSGVLQLTSPDGTGTDKQRQAAQLVRHALSGVHLYRWNPRFLALPVAPDAQRRFRMESSGFGLALCLDDILGYDRDQFGKLEQRLRSIFPQIKTIRLLQMPAYHGPVDDTLQIPILHKADGKGIFFELHNGQQVSAAQMSDGILLVLAYLTVLYLPAPYRPRVVLVEEPENGIHPKRLQDVLGILRDLVTEQTMTQVLLTTHSPYVVDLFTPEEVSLCQMTSEGSVFVQRLSDSTTVQEQADIFTLGEIWTAEGDEALAPHGKSDELLP